MKDILLSFLEIVEPNFYFTVYRKVYDGAPKTDDELKVYKLPTEDKIYQPYYVATEPRESFDAYTCDIETNRDLTKYIILLAIAKQATGLGLDHQLNLHKFQSSIEIYTDNHIRGRRAIVFTPYYLQIKKTYGFLIDFHFRANPGFSRQDVESLKLSLSLDKFGNVNRNIYADKYNYVIQKLNELLPKFNPTNYNGAKISLKENFSYIPISALSKKLYLFNKGNDTNQYRGISKLEPYKTVSEPCLFVFIMEDRFKNFGNKLYLSLIGKQNPGTFPGMKQIFKIHMGTDNVKRIHIANTDNTELDNAIRIVQKIKESSPDSKLIIVYIEENNNIEEAGISQTYYYFKYHLTKMKIPLQVLSHERINVEKTLKWSTSNIGLALFSKLGGIPWVVKPSTSNCLILGIGSAHKLAEDGSIERFFAYSVCLDSSGLYKKLEVLADDHSEVSYLEALQRNLTNLIKSKDFTNYSKCALHLPFKIKQSEIESIESAISNIRTIEFKVIKINIKNKFFGYSEHNTRTPYESTLVELNKSEFLIWFEGLQFGREILNDRISPPVHIQFLNSDYTSKESVNTYLQDIINLTGTNWRGFNAKVKPISIYYSTIIAKYCKNFEDFPDFRKEMLSLDIPWFL